MTNQQTVQLGRKLLPLLGSLLGASAPEARRKLQRLLAQAESKGVAYVAPQILALLISYPGIRKLMKSAPEARSAGRPAKAGVLVAARKATPKKKLATARRGSVITPAEIKKLEKHLLLLNPQTTVLGKFVKRGAPIKILSAKPSEVPPAPGAKPKPQTYKTVTIHYATDRAVTGQTKPAEFYGPERAVKGLMSYGTCNVSIPFTHKKGDLEGPGVLRKEDPRKHVILLGVSPLDAEAFFASADRNSTVEERKEAFVFVHGFNVTFKDAARRTAQIANDLPFKGLPVLYSWPSRGSEQPLAYTADEATIEWTIPHLRKFLDDLVTKSGITTLHLIAHSMGNRAVARALQLVALRSPGKAVFHEVFLTAPDIDRTTFEEMVAEFVGAAQRVTLYASADDWALKVSKKLHHEPRAGDATGSVVQVSPMDSVDATGVDTSFLGHSYYGSDRTVLTDLYYALKGEAAAQREATIEAVPGQSYYRFRP